MKRKILILLSIVFASVQAAVHDRIPEKTKYKNLLPAERAPFGLSGIGAFGGGTNRYRDIIITNNSEISFQIYYNDRDPMVPRVSKRFLDISGGGQTYEHHYNYMVDIKPRETAQIHLPDTYDEQSGATVFYKPTYNTEAELSFNLNLGESKEVLLTSQTLADVLQNIYVPVVEQFDSKTDAFRTIKYIMFDHPSRFDAILKQIGQNMKTNTEMDWY